MGWLILAAGQSRRFGGDKLTASLGPGNTTLLEASLKPYIAEGSPILVVVRPEHYALHRTLSELKVPFTVCDEAGEGMGASLAWGVGQVAKAWAWCGVGLADMPFISSNSIVKLAEAAATDIIVVPELVQAGSESRLGHPRVFGGEFFSALATLSGDRGAKAVLAQHASSIKKLKVEDRGVVLDIDRPEELEKARSAARASAQC